MQDRGMRTFGVVWLGQLMSLIGSGLTGFALGVWVFQRTGSVTKFALISVSATLPTVLLSPFAGVLVDRWDRRKVMIFADCAAAVGTLAVAVLLATDQLEIWHIYVSMGLSAAAAAFQWPAYSAATTLLVPKQHLARAAGMVQFARAGSQILAPLLAGVLIVNIQIHGILIIDFVTFLLAVGSLMAVRIPAPPRRTDGAPQKSVWREMGFAWSYLQQRPGLVRLLGFFTATNFFGSQALGLIVPLILAFNAADHLGYTLSIAASGMIVGSLVISIWGGPSRRVFGVLGGGSLLGISLWFVGLQPSLVLIAVALFAFNFAIAVLNSCSQAIWQSKLAPDLQGRVFAFRRMLATFTTPMGYLLAGPLADRLFEPWLAVGGPLADSVGRWIGVGAGRGIGFYFIVLGTMALLVSVWGWRSSRLVRLELELPDHDVLSSAEPVKSQPGAGKPQPATP